MIDLTEWPSLIETLLFILFGLSKIYDAQVFLIYLQMFGI